MARDKYSLALPNILVVDDVIENCDLISSYLTAFEKINVMKAGSGWLALDYYRKYEYALILLDVDMPKMDGFELVRQMKKFKPNDITPIIYITGHDKNSDRTTIGYELGAVDFLNKPFDMEFLLKKVRVFLNLFHQRKLLEKEVAVKSASQIALIESNSLINEIVKDRYEFVCAFDKNGKVESINTASLTMLRIKSLDNIQGMPITNFIYIGDLNLFNDSLAKVRLGEEIKIKIRFQSADKTYLWLHLTLMPKMKDCQLQKVFCIGEQISESDLNEKH